MRDKKFRQEITQESEILLFGKHKYQTIQHVIRTDPRYLLWLHEESIVKFPLEMVQEIEDSVDDDEPLDYGEFSEFHFGDR